MECRGGPRRWESGIGLDDCGGCGGCGGWGGGRRPSHRPIVDIVTIRHPSSVIQPHHPSPLCPRRATARTRRSGPRGILNPTYLFGSGPAGRGETRGPTESRTNLNPTDPMDATDHPTLTPGTTRARGVGRKFGGRRRRRKRPATTATAATTAATTSGLATLATLARCRSTWSRWTSQWNRRRRRRWRRTTR